MGIINRRISLNRVLAWALLMAVSSHSTPSAANSLLATVTAEERAACTGDVMKFCRSEIPNVSKVIACMKRERPNLSAACAAAYDARLGGSKTATRSLASSL